MSWPTPLDYQAALQNPQSSLADPELRAGKVENDQMGLPKPRTGTFASVYKVQCGQRTWAIRCFLMDFRDQQERYTAISNHLAKVTLPYTVGFEYIPKGILVGKQWYPILKMEWVEGERLDRYIEKNLHNPSVLLSLARKWIEMVKRLQQASIAHGDFQHGNIIVERDNLRLIDYDGMFVPELKGRVSHETGHRNYQHPKRKETDFGLYLDNFSAWVVYLSLMALSMDADLWQRFKGGDECLLFRSHDFEQPDSSDLFKTLEKSPDEHIRSAAALFKALLFLNPQQIPFLDSQAPLPSASVTALPAWLKDHVRPVSPKLPGSPAASLSSSVVDPSWIFDFLEPKAGKSLRLGFENPVSVERLTLAFSALSTFLLFYTHPLPEGIIIIGLVAIVIMNSLLWMYRYHLEPAVEKLTNLRTDLRNTNSSISQVESQIKAFEQDKTEIRNHFKARLTQIETEKKELDETREEKIDKSQKALQSALAALDERRRITRQQEANAIQNIQREHGTKVARLSRQIGDLIQAETDEIHKTLQDRQQEHTTQYLRRKPVQDANLSNIGATLTARLAAAGILTAAEIDYDRVKLVNGIGSGRANALVQWKQNLEAVAGASMPQTLSRNELASINKKYQDIRIPLEDQRNLEKQRLEAEEKAVRQRNAALFQRYMKEDESARAKAQREIARINNSHDKALHAKENAFLKLSKKTEAELQRENSRISEARKKFFDLHWKQEKLKRQMAMFAEVSFSSYLKRLFQIWNP